MKFLFVLVTCLSHLTDVNGQNTKHSITNVIVNYSIAKIENDDKSKLPTEYLFFGKNDMSRAEISANGTKKIIISDNLSRAGFLLSAKGKSKSALKLNPLNIKSKSANYSVELTRESKSIAGFVCYKAFISKQTFNGPVTKEVWFNSEIKCRNGYGITILGINGLLMEFETQDLDHNTYKLTAQKVDVSTLLGDSLFRVPKGYKIVERE